MLREDSMRVRRLGSLAVSVAILTSLVGVGTPARATIMCADATLQGCWSVPFSPFGEFDTRPPKTVAESAKYPSAASIAVMPDGRIVYFNGLQDLEKATFPLPLDAGRVARNSESKVLDLSGAPLFVDVATNDGDDMFCADIRTVASGKVMVAGGTVWKSDVDLTPVVGPGGPGGAAELYGSNNTHFFDGTAWEPIETSPKMKYGRWYPTMLTLPDGDMFIAGGVEKLLYNTKGFNVNAVEIFDRETGRWIARDEETNATLPLFARMHLLPSGEVFYTGAGQMWGPAGETLDQALWNLQKTYNAATNTWTLGGMGAFGARSGAFSAMLPLRPPYTEAQMLLGGGTLGTSPGSYVAHNLTEIITAKDGNGDGKWEASSVRGPDMNNRRWYSSAVVLPNGEVLAANGGDKDEVVSPGTETPVKQIEIYSGGAWKAVAKLADRIRTYHNSLILLGDGSVLIGGHAPINNQYGPGADANPATDISSSLKDPSFERYFPPYLFNGERPVISTAQKGATWGSDLVITLDPESTDVTKVVLSRLPSATHATDADARTVEVTFEQTGTALHVNVPDNAAVLPPGYYYAFALSADGTPSVAPIVKIDRADLVDQHGTVQPVELGTPASVR